MRSMVNDGFLGAGIVEFLRVEENRDKRLLDLLITQKAVRRQSYSKIFYIQARTFHLWC
jgi:hypothetical protein